MVTMSKGYMLRLLFNAWLEDYKVARRARRWFHEQGGRERAESEEETDWYWPDGDDPISSLPRKISVKVCSLSSGAQMFAIINNNLFQIFGLIGIQGLCSCARVCRSWKDITEDGHLWNKVLICCYV